MKEGDEDVLRCCCSSKRLTTADALTDEPSFLDHVRSLTTATGLRLRSVLLDAYRALGVSDAVPVQLDIREPLDHVGAACVQWELRRADGSPIYDSTAIYTLARVDGGLRIVAIAHDEAPKLQARLAGSRSSP